RLILFPINFKSECYLLVNGFWKRIRLLEYHTHFLTIFKNVNFIFINIHVVDKNLALNCNAFNQIVHSVETAQKSRLATSRWPDKGGDRIFQHGDGNIPQGLLLTIEQIKVSAF